jgi:hypothetical protein
MRGTLSIADPVFRDMANRCGVTESVLGWLQYWGTKYPDIAEFIGRQVIQLSVELEFVDAATAPERSDETMYNISIEHYRRVFSGVVNDAEVSHIRDVAYFLDSMGMHVRDVLTGLPLQQAALTRFAAAQDVDPIELHVVMMSMNAWMAFENSVMATFYLEARESKLTDLNRVTSLAANLGEVSTRLEVLADDKRSGSNGLAGAVRSVQAEVVELTERASKVGAVIDLIRGIADQTNLLALNATIEAARAGEQGKGFAVVAGEVKVLARSTKESLGSIGALTEDIRTGTERMAGAVGFMETAAEQVRQDAAMVASIAEQLVSNTSI